MRAQLIGGFSRAMALASTAPWGFNLLVTNAATSGMFKRLSGFVQGRSITKLNRIPLRRWHRFHANKEGPFANGRVFLFCDEFTNFNDESVGIKAVRLLNRLGYEVGIPKHFDSGHGQSS